jgi:hypothetical protein
MPLSSTSLFSTGAALGGISDKPPWLEAEALFGPLDHGHCRVDLGLADGAGCFKSTMIRKFTSMR